MSKTIRRKHYRRTRRGQVLVRTHDMQVPAKVRKQIIDEEMTRLVKELKEKKRARVDGLGILKLKHIKASPGGKEIELFGKKVITKPKPARTKIKFAPSKKLKEEFI